MNTLTKGQIIKNHKRQSGANFNFLYRILATNVYMTENNDTEDYIVYQSLYDDEVWCRPTGMFYEMIEGKPRFSVFTLSDFHNEFCTQCCSSQDVLQNSECLITCPYLQQLQKGKAKS